MNRKITRLGLFLFYLIARIFYLVVMGIAFTGGLIVGVFLMARDEVVECWLASGVMAGRRGK